MWCNNLFSRALALMALASLITACGGGGGGSTPAPALTNTPSLTGLPIPPVVTNQLGIYVDAGPPNTGYNVNRLYTDVTICYPGRSTAGSATQCQTIDHVLVDTGSTGLRLLSSAMAPALNLGHVTGASGFPLLNCAQFVDSTYAWGPVVSADIVLAGMKANNVPIQVMGDASFNSLATAAVCSGTTALTTVQELGAKGIIGLGLFKEDCGQDCVNHVGNGRYFTCSNASCTATVLSKATLDQQVNNLVPLFAGDNNGVVVDLPAVVQVSLPSLTGSLYFGIGTRSNNTMNSGSMLAPQYTVGAGWTNYITTVLPAATFLTSFIDSGSNGLYFDSSSITKCVGDKMTDFYCPGSTATTTFSATLQGANAVTKSVSFSVGNASALFTTGNPVLPTLAGSIGFAGAGAFDWGLPFFYGRRIGFGIEGQSTSLGVGPFYAF